MVSQVVIHTYCDRDYQDEDRYVDGETITWFVDGERMEVDLCKTHKDGVTLDQLDALVRRYGREWVDPQEAARRASEAERKRAQRATRPSSYKKIDPHDHVLIDGYLTNDLRYVCTVAECARRQEPIEKIQGFRMHQFQAHGMHAPPKKEKEK